MHRKCFAALSAAFVLFLLSACPNQLMRDLVEQKLASPAAGLFQINLGAAGTALQSVTLRSQVSKNNDALEMRFKNESGDWSGWQKYSDSAGWTLTPGDNGSLGALKTVYAEFRDEGHHVVSLQDSIVYCAAVPNGNFFVWGTGTQAGALHTQINTINSSLYISVADAVDMRFNNDGGAWSAWMPYSTTAAWPLSAIDGARTVNAEFRNAGGSNVLTPNYTINLDTIAPTFGAPLSINGAAPVSYSASVSLTYATPDGIWVEYQNDGGAWTAREALASPRTWTLAAAAGSRTVGIRITDVAGNQTVGAPASINLVTAAPAPSTVSPTAALRPTWTWPAFSGATTYRMQMDSTAGAWTVIGNVTSYTPGSDLSVGMHTLYLQAQDPAGNWSAIGSSPVTIDLSAPGAPTLTVPSPTTDNTPTWSWLAVPDTASYLYQLDTTTGTWTEVPSSTLSFTPGSPLSDGQHTLFLQAKKNLTGTLSPMASAATRIDTTAPGAPGTPSNVAASDGWINLAERNAGISITVPLGASGAVPGDILELLLNGSVFQPARTLTAGDISAAQYTFVGVAGSLGADGVKTITARVTDQVGNVGPQSPALTFTQDRVAPTVVVSYSGHPDTIVKAGDVVTFTATFTEANGILSPRISIGSVVTNAVMTMTGPLDCYYPWTVSAGFEGIVAISINATDSAGNPNSAATGVTSFRIDNTVPTTPTVSGVSHTNITTPTWTWSSAFDSGSGVAAYRVQLDGGTMTDVGLALNYTPGSGLPAGAHTLNVFAVDVAGNWSTAGSFVTTVYAYSVQFQAGAAGMWFGGDNRAGSTGRNVGGGQRILFNSAMLLKTFAFNIDGSFGGAVTLVLNVRDGTSHAILSTHFLTLSAGFNGGWVYWTGINRSIAAGAWLEFTAYVQDGGINQLNSGISGDGGTGGQGLSCSVGNTTTPATNAEMETWVNWSTHSWNFWHQAFGD